MIEIREVKTKKEIKQFIDFPLKLYKGNKNFVPPIYMDEKKCFRKDYMYLDQAEAKYWLCYKDGKVAGRISAIIQHKANEKWHQKRCRFTRFDAINDQEVANALFATVEAYAKEKGMEEVVGPLGFSDLEREGLLIEGFDYLSTFEEQYNFDYYQKLIENCGYGKDVDWIEHRLTFDDDKYKKLVEVSDRILSRGKLHLAEDMPYKKFVKLYGDQFFEMLDVSYNKIYGTVPFTRGMRDLLENNFSPIINMDFVKFVMDENNNLVAFAVAFPGIGEALQKSGGRLTLPAIIKLLKQVKSPHIVDLGLVGIDPKATLSGAQVVCYAELSKAFHKYNIDYVETNLNLEDNKEIIGTWSHFNALQHKRRRSFVKKI